MKLWLGMGALLLLPLSLSANPSIDDLTQRLVQSFNRDEAPQPPAKAFEDLYAEAFGEGGRPWILQSGEVALGPERAVVTLVLVSVARGHPVDTLYAYAQNREGWVWTGLNEDRAFRNAFLRGWIEGNFKPEALPSLPELTRLGASLNGAIESLSGVEWRYDSRWHQASQRGALLMVGEPDESGDAPQAVLYFRRSPTGWELLGSGYRLSVEGFFPDPLP